ncbi:MAG: hypothetical protein V2A61_06425, partial [Calditrichota bacterium]
GHRHTTSLLRPIITQGCRIFDHGILTPPVIYHGRIFRYSHFIWQVNSVSWHDVRLEDHLNNLKSHLDMGSFALMGAHYALFGNWSIEGARARAIQLLGWMESDYPNLKWLKAEEWADFWDELAEIKNIRQTEFGDHIQLNWEGASHLSETVLVVLSDSSLSPICSRVDRVDQPWIQRGNRVFVVCLNSTRENIHLIYSLNRYRHPIQLRIHNSGRSVTPIETF